MAKKLIVEVVGDSRSYERALGRSAKATKTFQAGITGMSGSVFKGLAAFTGVAVGARGLSNALSGSVRDFGSFEQSMQRTVGLSGVAQSAIKGLSAEVLRLAPVVGKSPQELADALYFVTSSGISAAHAMDVVAVSAKASAAGLGDTATVADAVTSAMNAYGQANLSASQASDVLVATVREGKGEATDFAGVIGNVAALAAQLGVSFDQVGAALAAQTRLGTDAETSATQLQRVFSTLVKVTPQSAKAFESVGLNADDLRATLAQPGGLLIVLEQVRKAFGNNIPAMAKAFGDVRALRGVLSLVGKQGAATAGIFDRLAKSSGATKSAFGAISETQAQQFAKLNATLKVLSITLGSALAPAILDIVRPLNAWFAKTENQREAQKKLKDTVRGAISGIKDFIDAVKPLAGFAKDASDKLGGLKRTLELLAVLWAAGKVTSYAAALTGVGTAAAGSTAKVNVLRTALLRLGAIGLITLGVEVLIHKDEIDKAVKGFLRGHHLGAVAGTQINIPVKVSNLDKFKELRTQTAKLKGENDLLVKTYDTIIARLEAIATASSRIPDESQRPGLGGPGTTAAAPRTTPRRTPASTTHHGPTAAELARAAAAEAKRRAAAAAKAIAAATTAYENMIDALSLKLDKAQVTRGFKDNLAALNLIRQTILDRIKVVGKTTDLARQLFENTQQLKETTANARKAAQFKELGLTTEGEKPTASSAALLHRAKGIQNLIKGTALDTKKTRSELRRIVNFLKTHLKTAGREVRQAILDMLNGIKVPDSASKTGPLTKTAGLNTKKLLEGLGLSPDDERELRGRLSHFNTAGRRLAGSGSKATGGGGFVDDRPIVVHTTVNIDGQKVANNTTRHQQKTRRRNPQQKRGPHRIGGI